MATAVVDEKIRPPTVLAVDRSRLDDTLTLRRGHRQIGLLVAPPGSGKTTLLARFCARADFPVAWLQADDADSEPDRFLAYLGAAIQRIRPGFGDHTSIDDLVAELGTLPAPIGLVIDDLHALDGSPAEHLVDRLVRYFPRQGMLLLAARRAPSLDLSRLRLADELVELDGEALRFRTWEVEQLFRDHYRSPLPPVELAELARRTNGWAAGLQLFHLATAGKPNAARRATLASLTRSRHVRDYLTRNVLADLPDELGQLLLDTCVFGIVTPELCDAFRGVPGSARLLAELHRRQIFTTAVDETGTYRYHEVLRSHLQSILVEENGDGYLRQQFQRAGEVLELAGNGAEAVAAFARAGAVERVTELLRGSGRDLALEPGDWIDALPPSVAEHDAWVALAAARWHVRAGRWEAAADAYGRGLELFGSEAVSAILQTERTALMAFDRPEVGAENRRPDRWDRVILRAAQQNPAALTDPIDGGSMATLAAGLAAMLAGWPKRATELLYEVARNPDAGPITAAAARLAMAASPHWAPGSPPAGPELAHVAADIEEPGGPWLAAVASAAMSLTGIDRGGAGDLPTTTEPWSGLLSRYLQAVGAVSARPEAALADFEVAAKEARSIAASTLEAWCLAGAAYAGALCGAPAALEATYTAEAAARAAGVPGARAVAFAALAVLEPTADNRQLATSTAQECGLDLRVANPPMRSTADCELRCLGGLRIVIDRAPMDLGDLKPRWRSLLGLLAVHGGRPVHRDTILAALWPEVGEAAGRRSLQVGISGIRGCLDRGRAAGDTTPSAVVRVGDAYALRLPGIAWSDIESLQQGLVIGREARRAGDLHAASEALAGALSAYGGEVLPEEGAPEWLIELRDQLRSAAATVAALLAQTQLDLGNPQSAADTAAAGVLIDRYRDDLWRLHVGALEHTGDTANLVRVRAAYAAVLAELDVS